MGNKSTRRMSQILVFTAMYSLTSYAVIIASHNQQLCSLENLHLPGDWDINIRLLSLWLCLDRFLNPLFNFISHWKNRDWCVLTDWATERPTDWLTDWQTDGLTGWLIDWRLVGGWSDGRTVGPANRRTVGRSDGRTVGRSVGSHGQSNDQSTVCQLINRLITKEKIQTVRFFIFPYFCTNVELIGTPTLSSVVLAKDILFSFTLYAYLDSHKTQPWDKCPYSRKLGEYGQIWQLLGLLADLSWLLTCHCFQQKPVENPS